MIVLCWCFVQSCKNFNDAKRCVPFCPPLEKYDPLLKKYVLNPGVKYAYGSQCVEECPSKQSTCTYTHTHAHTQNTHTRTYISLCPRSIIVRFPRLSTGYMNTSLHVQLYMYILARMCMFCVCVHVYVCGGGVYICGIKLMHIYS